MAVAKGDSEYAAERLELAEALGNSLERQGGDATLADAVRAIHAQTGDARATRDLAEAHRAYRDAREDYNGGNRQSAAVFEAAAFAERAPSIPLRNWAMWLQGAWLVSAERYAEAERTYRDLLEEVDTLRNPSLVASVHGGLATTWLRAGNYEQALAAARHAARFFDRAGERERAGAALHLQASAEFLLGSTYDAYASLHRALMMLRSLRTSEWLHNTLSVGAEEVARDGYIRTAIRLQTEGLNVAERLNLIQYRAEALLWRARFLASAGERDLAEADIKAGEEIVRLLESEESRDWFEADLRIARASVVLERFPAQAKAGLDSVIEKSRGLRTEVRLLQALVRRADAQLALGNPHGAVADLDSAVRLLEKQREAVASAPLRSSLLDEVRAVFDRMVMLQANQGQMHGALEYLERGLTSFSPAESDRPAVAKNRWSMPRGSAAVIYALVGDTLLIWTLTDSTVRMFRETVDRTELVERIERVGLSLERFAANAAVLNDLTALYAQLIRPVQDQLRHQGTWVIIADGELAGIPFAALHDASTGYLIEHHALRFASSLRDALRPARQPAPPVGEALLVADPAFSPREYPTLNRLPQSVQEVTLAAAEYQRRGVLRGTQATRAALDTALPRATIFHFAGHAVFDDVRPERSYLLLAADSMGRSGRLTPTDVEGMDLRNVRLVVLSGCETLRAREGRSSGFAGFAGALLAAGAQGVVGSHWRVDDESTRQLMVTFHDVYSKAGNGPAALREAQLALIRSTNPRYTSPAAWAGFRYAGN